jgi:hypothetical protein
MNQLGLDGAETPHPLRGVRPLSPRQRQVVLYMRAHQDRPVRPLEVGMLMHAGRERVHQGRGAWTLATHTEAWA